MAGKNMNYFLMDSTPNGRIKCTLANWTGVAYKIPRIKLVDCRTCFFHRRLQLQCL